MLLVKQALIDEKINKIKQEKQEVRQEKADKKKKMDIEKAELSEKFKLVQQGKANPEILKLALNQDANNSFTESSKPKKRKQDESTEKEGGYKDPFPDKQKFESKEEEKKR